MTPRINRAKRCEAEISNHSKFFPMTYAKTFGEPLILNLSLFGGQDTSTRYGFHVTKACKLFFTPRSNNKKEKQQNNHAS